MSSEAPEVSPKVKLIFNIIRVLFCGGVLFLGLKAVDAIFQKVRMNTYRVDPTWYDKPTVTSYDLYPYTGPHAQAHFHETAPTISWVRYPKFDFRTGDHGFTSDDIDFASPPEKRPNEFRIIMIGGSTAWGEGAQSNERMHFRLLERMLNEAFKKKGVRFRIINMAMSGSMTYQNFIALNRWGHALRPDFILSFSGRNDWFVPTKSVGTQGTDLPNQFEKVLGLVAAANHYSSPEWLIRLGHWFPGMIQYTNLGKSIRMVRYGKYIRAAYKKYKDDNPGFDVVKQYAHALRSIKRDFEGIPIMVAAQPILDESSTGEYAKFIAETFSQLRKNTHYNKFYLVDMHTSFQESPFFQDRDEVRRTLMIDTVHFTNEGQKLVAEKIAKELVPVLEKELRTR